MALLALDADLLMAQAFWYIVNLGWIAVGIYAWAQKRFLASWLLVAAGVLRAVSLGVWFFIERSIGVDLFGYHSERIMFFDNALETLILLLGFTGLFFWIQFGMRATKRLEELEGLIADSRNRP